MKYPIIRNIHQYQYHGNNSNQCNLWPSMANQWAPSINVNQLIINGQYYQWPISIISQWKKANPVSQWPMANQLIYSANERSPMAIPASIISNQSIINDWPIHHPSVHSGLLSIGTFSACSFIFYIFSFLYLRSLFIHSLILHSLEWMDGFWSS